MTEEEIKILVDQEMAKRRVAHHFSEKKSKYETVSRHPAFITVLGFSLTVLVGGWYDSIREGRRTLEQARMEALSAVNALIDSASKRRVYGALLASGMKRGISSRTLQERKAKYDEAYVSWNMKLTSTVSILRYHLGSNSENIYEDTLNDYFFPWFATVDMCLTDAFDSYLQEGSDFLKSRDRASMVLERCRSPQVYSEGNYVSIQQANVALWGCEMATLETLAVSVRLGQKEGDAGWEALEEKVPKKFEEFCSPNWMADI